MTETFFEQLNFGLKHLDLLLFFKLASRVLLSRQSLILQFKMVDFVLLLDLLDLVLEISFLLVLKGAFVFESLILGLDVTLNLTDVLLSFRLCTLLEIF